MAQGTPSQLSVENQLHRILESDAFKSSPLLARFLSFTVEQTLNGNAEIIKESTLGAEVCGRNNFDPRYDSVVRTTATRLRSKLADYYAASGTADPILIEFPKGSYIPVFRDALEAAAIPPASPSMQSAVEIRAVQPQGYPWTPALTGALIAVSAGWGFWMWFGRAQPPKPEFTRRFSIAVPQGIAPSLLVSSGPARISPDGRLVAVSYLQAGSPNYRIFIHDLESAAWRPLHDHDIRGFQPAWSTDSRELIYGNYSKMFRIRADGTQMQVVAEIPNGYNSASWSDQGQILFSSRPLDGLALVSASGGKPVPLTKPKRPAEQWHYAPVFLPGGREFLYTAVASDRSQTSIYVTSISRPEERKKLLTGASSAGYYPLDETNGMLVFQGTSSLMAVRYHTGRRELEGEPFSIAPTVAMDVSRGLADFSVSHEGTLLTRSGLAVQLRQLRLIDGTGHSLRQSAVQGLYRFPALSPDASQVATGLIDHTTGLETIWILDRDLKNPRRLVPGTVAENTPKWSPDGKRIAFIREGEIHAVPVSGLGKAEKLTTSGGPKNTCAWTPDGREILFYEHRGPELRGDILAIAPAPGSQPRVIVSTSANENDAMISPDGKHIVFLSDEGGKTEVYLQNFPQPGETAPRHIVQLSAGGGYAPRFSANGNEVQYVLSDNSSVMSVRVSGGAVVGSPRLSYKTKDWFHRGYGHDCVGSGATCVVSAPGDPPQLSSPQITLHPRWSSQR